MSPDEDDDETELSDPPGPPPRIGGSQRRPLSRREFPVDQPDFEDDGTDPCPHCGAMIYADGEWCPKCGHYLSGEDAPAGKSFWVVAVLVAVLLGSLVLAVVAR